MKNYWIAIIVVLVLALMGGCGDGNNVESELGDGNEPETNVDETVSPIDENNNATPDQNNAVDDLEAAEGEEEIEVEKELEPRYVLQNSTVKPIDQADNARVVLLTIDDAPEKYGVEIAELLKGKGVNAIFFVNGHFIANEAGREKLQSIYDLGFEIGNHSMTHPNLRNISEAKQREEIVALNDLIEEITGERPRFFRAPFGVNTDVSRQVVEEENMQSMNWSFGYDFEKEYMEKDALADIMVNTPLLSSGANLLMHDRKWTLEALPEIISGLQEKDYEFVDPKTIQ